jgi:hypothetical protein
VRYGVYVALLDDSVSESEMLFRLRFVEYGVFRQCCCEVRSFRCRLSFKRCLSEDFKGFLCGLEQEWAKIPG